MRALAFFISFLMAFLLFSVQPMATRMVLPTLGGTAAVWNTVMFTFQLLLLAGYAYAHLLVRFTQTRGQFAIHATLLAASFFFLPLWVNLTTSDALITAPISHLVHAFLLQLGVPFFCVAATAPLLQSWVSRSGHPLSKTPYVLYSASNLGSFMGLLGYVALVEPLFDLPTQSIYWSVLYGAGGILLLLLAVRLRPAATPRSAGAHSAPVAWRTRLTWIGLAFLPSSLSLGVTTYITTDVTSLPLLWVLPLSLYLLSFVDAFRTRPIVVQYCQQIAPLAALSGVMLLAFASSNFTQLFMVHLLLFAVLAFALHGWLAAKRPEAQYLTQFYLCLSVGGALGGVLNGLLAPVLFHEAIEYPAMLLVAGFAAFILLRRRENTQLAVRHYGRVLLHVAAVLLPITVVLYAIRVGVAALPEGLIAAALVKAVGIAGLLTLAVFRRYVQAFFTLFWVALVVLVGAYYTPSEFTKLWEDRNFFGVSRVYANTERNAHYFMHDTTVHGVQSLSPADRLKVQAYYAPLRDVFSRLPVTTAHPFAVAGLGAGTLKCLAKPAQQVDLYDINPMVMDIAKNPKFFTYLRDCPGTHQLLLGDARLRLAQQNPARYGAIILDAFSSDAIPSHLLTREAIAMYLTKLVPDGVLLLNVTNRHVNLLPLLAAQTKALNVVGYEQLFATSATDNPLVFRSHWVVIAASPTALSTLRESGKWKLLVDEGNPPWTDQYVNLLPYFNMLRGWGIY